MSSNRSVQMMLYKEWSRCGKNLGKTLPHLRNKFQANVRTIFLFSKLPGIMSPIERNALIEESKRVLPVMMKLCSLPKEDVLILDKKALLKQVESKKHVYDDLTEKSRK
jgi:hypothetical protein